MTTISLMKNLLDLHVLVPLGAVLAPLGYAVLRMHHGPLRAAQGAKRSVIYGEVKR